jgi:hypothetical protein
MANIKEKLEKEKRSINQEIEQIVNGAQKLLAANEDEEKKLLRQIGMGKPGIEAEERLGANIEIKTLEKVYKDNIYEIDQIKRLCLTYRLRFLSARNYQGPEHPELGIKLARFIKENKISVDSTDFKVLAPVEYFEGNYSINWTKAFEVKLDPALFYKADGKGRYALIHAWGKDFTLFRFIQGFIFRTRRTFALSLAIGFSFIITSIIAAFCGGLHLLAFGIIFSSLVGIGYGFAHLIASENKKIFTNHILQHDSEYYNR